LEGDILNRKGTEMRAIQYLMLSVFCVIISLALIPSKTSAILAIMVILVSLKGLLELTREEKKK